MDEVRFEPTNPDDVVAAGRSRKVRRRVVGGVAFTVLAVLGGTGVSMATGAGFSPAITISPATTGHTAPSCSRIIPGSGIHIGRKPVTGNRTNIGNVCSTPGKPNTIDPATPTTHK